MLLDTGDEASVEALLDGVHTLLLQSAAQEASAAAGGEEPARSFRSEHALDSQRFQNVACWVFGSESELYSAMVEEGPLPDARAALCPAEWTQMAGTCGRLLAPHGQP